MGRGIGDGFSKMGPVKTYNGFSLSKKKIQSMA